MVIFVRFSFSNLFLGTHGSAYKGFLLCTTLYLAMLYYSYA